MQACQKDIFLFAHPPTRLRALNLKRKVECIVGYPLVQDVISNPGDPLVRIA